MLFFNAEQFLKIGFPDLVGYRVKDIEFCNGQQDTSSLPKWNNR